MSTVNIIKEILDQKRDELLKQLQEEIVNPPKQETEKSE